uniref:Uncharacterized protein n=1 Tax=Sus scrofa TaxID=9823 RepID=A0A8D0N0S2_PIG
RFLLEKDTGCLGVQRPAHPPKLSLCHRYFENIPKGLDREGWTRGGIQPQKPGSRALNQPVTCTEAVPSPTESLRRLHPYVGRSLISADPLYRASPHSSHGSRFTAPN